MNGVVFKGPFPEKTTFSLEIPAGLKDDAGRVPVNAAAFPLTVKTDAFPASRQVRRALRDPRAVRRSGAAGHAQQRRAHRPGRRCFGIPSGPAGLREWMKGKVLRVPPDRAAEILPWLQALASAKREKSMFSSLPGGHADQDVRLAQAGRLGSDGSRRHSAQGAGLLPGRDRERATGPGAPRQAQARCSSRRARS